MSLVFPCSNGLTDDAALATTSEANTPLSGIYRMQQAQEELCEMLGISPEDLRATPVSSRPKRSMSLSATMRSPRSAHSFMTRSSSDGLSPNLRVSETWRLHRSHSLDGMVSATRSVTLYQSDRLLATAFCSARDHRHVVDITYSADIYSVPSYCTISGHLV